MQLAGQVAAALEQIVGASSPYGRAKRRVAELEQQLVEAREELEFHSQPLRQLHASLPITTIVGQLSTTPWLLGQTPRPPRRKKARKRGLVLPSKKKSSKSEPAAAIAEPDVDEDPPPGGRAPYLQTAERLAPPLRELFWGKDRPTRAERRRLDAGIQRAKQSVSKERARWEGREAAAAESLPQRLSRLSD